jgi:hypothetical protein
MAANIADFSGWPAYLQANLVAKQIARELGE